jgi:drug/metabolite transporter (DMT)-like permease
LAAAAALAAAAVLSRRFALRYPARQLPGPLFALNAAVVAPAAPFGGWTVSWHIAAVLGASVAVMIVTAVAIFELFAEGSATAVTAGTAVSPLAAVVFSSLLLPTGASPTEIAAAAIVATAVLAALTDSFADLTRGRAAALLVTAAGGNGLLTVLGKQLVDAGAGVVEIYLVRTSLAAVVLMAVFPPRDLPARELPRMAVRASAITASFLLILVGLKRGSATSVQTMVATAPLILIAAELAFRKRRPSGRVALAALSALAGVAVVLGSSAR